MKDRKYKIKITPELKKKLQRFWTMYQVIEDDYWEQIREAEKEMRNATGITDIEFFFNDGELAGIGNVSRTMPLIHREYK